MKISWPFISSVENFYRLSREKVSAKWTICNGPHRMCSKPKALELLKEADSYGVNPLTLYYEWKLILKSKGVVMTEYPCFWSLFLMRKW